MRYARPRRRWRYGSKLAAGFDIYQSQTNFDQATFQSNTIGATARMGFPISEFSSVSLSYQYKIEEVRPYAGAPLDVQLAAGSLYGSILAFTYAYNDLDDAVERGDPDDTTRRPALRVRLPRRKSEHREHPAGRALR